MRRAHALAMVLVIGSTLVGCISPQDPLGRHAALAEVQRRYTDFVRWGDLQRASSYVAPELREEFMAYEGPLSTFRLTDVEIGDIEFEEESAFVTVTYKGYSLSHLVEHTARVQQEWVHAGGIKNDAWQVRPELDVLVAALRGVEPKPGEQ